MIQVYGHQNILKSLKVYIQNHTLPHSLIFFGPSGVGKKHTAFYTATCMLCRQKKSPCGKCRVCRKIQNKEHEDVLLIQPEGLSIKMKAVSRIRSFLNLKSFSSEKIVIIDEAQRMNLSVQNALLKSLEEPPPHVHFILITSELHRLLKTIRSRSVHLQFYPLTLEDLKKILPSAQDLKLESCRGRMDYLHRWEGREPLRKEVFDFWSNIANSPLLSQELSSFLKKREDSLLVSRIWQEILRDLRVYQEGSNQLIHQNLLKTYEKLSYLPKETVSDLYLKTCQLEFDILSYLDSLLCFETFHQQAYKQVHDAR